MNSSIEDKLAIEELICHYNQSLDQGRYEAFLACWCEDAVLDGVGELRTGKAAIRAFTETYDDRYRLRLNGLKHFTVNIISQVDGDRARSSSYLQLVCTGSRGVRILLTGRYEDELRCEAGQWRFSRRKLHQDMPLPESPAEGSAPG